jgi:hypothetical protein
MSDDCMRHRLEALVGQKGKLCLCQGMSEDHYVKSYMLLGSRLTSHAVHR